MTDDDADHERASVEAQVADTLRRTLAEEDDALASAQLPPFSAAEHAAILDRLPRRRLPTRALFVSFAVAAAAAGIFFFWSPPSLLPRFDGSEFSADQHVRDAATAQEVYRISAETRVRWVLRPEVATSESAEVRFFVVQGEDVRPLRIDVQRGSQGSLRVETDGVALSLPPGVSTLHAVVTPERSMPDDASLRTLLVRGATGASSHIQVLSVRVERAQ